MGGELEEAEEAEEDRWRPRCACEVAAKLAPGGAQDGGGEDRNIWPKNLVTLSVVYGSRLSS